MGIESFLEMLRPKPIDPDFKKALEELAVALNALHGPMTLDIVPGIGEYDFVYGKRYYIQKVENLPPIFGRIPRKKRTTLVVGKEGKSRNERILEVSNPAWKEPIQAYFAAPVYGLRIKVE